MRPTNLPSARSPVVWTRGTPLWTITVNAGACAAARGTVTAPSRARNARPGLTSEAVVESQRESQGLPGGHCLRHVQAQPSPIDAEAQVGEPAAERREPIGGQSPGPAAHEPRLSRICEDNQVRALEGEERLRAFVQGPDLVVLADAGQAWLVGSGPGRLPADRLPTLGSWLADLGLGIDWGGLGLYVAKAVTAGEPLRFTLRLDHRF